MTIFIRMPCTISRFLIAGLIVFAAGAGQGQECTPLERTFTSDLVPVSMSSGGTVEGVLYPFDVIWINVKNIGSQPTNARPCERASPDAARLLRTEWVRQMVVMFYFHDDTPAWMRCEPVQPGATASVVTMIRSRPEMRCREAYFRLDSRRSGIQFGCNVYDNDFGTFYLPHPNRLCTAVPQLSWRGLR